MNALLIDIGNQRIKLAIAASPKRIRQLLAISSAADQAHIGKLLAQIAGTHKPRVCVIASVVPLLTPRVLAAVGAQLSKGNVFTLNFASFAKLMKTAVKPRPEPGADRLADVLALKALCPLPACVIGAGTAITINVVDRNGVFRGGAILPNTGLQLAALRHRTAQLSVVHDLGARAHVVGTDTRSAVTAGVLRGAECAVEGLVRDMQAELKTSFKTIIVTGGHGRRFAARLTKHGLKAEYDAAFTLRGLAWFAEQKL